MAFMGALISGGLGLLGSSMQSDSNASAARAAADAQTESARIAAEQAKFRPVGITTRFGQSNFGMSPEGYLTSAGYTVSPELQGYQSVLSKLQGGALTGAENAPSMYSPFQTAGTNALNLANQYIGQSPDEVARQYMLNQQNILAPTRERQLAGIKNQLENTGRTGLSIGGTGLRPGGGMGLTASNPELEAYYNAIAQQDLGLAANAQTAGQQNVLFGTNLANQAGGLFGQYNTGLVNSLSPFQTYLAANQGIESLGQAPLDIGAQLGGRAATAGANAGQFLYGGGMAAAKTMQPANQQNPLAGAIQGLSKTDLSSLWSGGGNYQLGSNPWGSTGNEPTISTGQTYTSPYFAG